MRLTIAFDFDGTLACWMPGIRPEYRDVCFAINHVAAIPASLAMLRAVAGRHEVFILTGRGTEHAVMIRRWLHSFGVDGIPVVCRPYRIGLSSARQAAWKAEELTKRLACLMVGDNASIDGLAATAAGCAYIDVATLIDGTSGWPGLLLDLQGKKQGK